MSGLEALSTGPRYRSATVPPTYWCTTCQMSLGTVDERTAHMKMFPAHRVKAVTRLVCPRCGNDVPLENGRFPDHWVGSSQDMRRCQGSGRHA